VKASGGCWEVSEEPSGHVSPDLLEELLADQQVITPDSRGLPGLERDRNSYLPSRRLWVATTFETTMPVTGSGGPAVVLPGE
jgi:hypothetical protein